MEIMQAKESDFIEILYLLRICIVDMNNKGLKHWNSEYPSHELIQEDLAKETIYLVKDKGVCKGMLTLDDTEPDEYKTILWSEPAKKPLFLHRLAVHPNWQGQGIARMLLDFAEEYAKKHNFDSIRIDVYSNSMHARNLCNKHMFQESGQFFSVFQQQPFICYGKKV
jgi:GNAT superfamily N-acetyltransferase